MVVQVCPADPPDKDRRTVEGGQAGMAGHELGGTVDVEKDRLEGLPGGQGKVKEEIKSMDLCG